MAASGCRSYRAFLDADRVELAPPDLQQYSRERTPRRTGDRGAGPEIEPPVMTRAEQRPFRGPRNDGAREVRTLLIEGHEFACGKPHQHARLVLVRIAKAHRRA